MFPVLVNTAAIILGAALGLVFKKGVSERMNTAVMSGLALGIIYIGVDGMLAGTNALLAVIALVLGGVCGTLLNIDGGLNSLGERLSGCLARHGHADNNFTQGFVTASLLFCVGAMAIVGSLEAGLTGDGRTLYTKAVMDGISASMLSASLGLGVMASAVAVLLYQGAIVLLSGLLSVSDALIAELTCVGSVLILALGLNMLNITKLKVADYLPALLFVPPLWLVMNTLGWL